MLIDKTDNFIVLRMEEKAATVSKEAFIESIRSCGLPESDTCDEEIEDNINSERKRIHDLGVNVICCTLVELQQLLVQHGVPAAAKAIEQGRNLIMRASWKARRPAVPVRTRQTVMDMFLKKK